MKKRIIIIISIIVVVILLTVLGIILFSNKKENYITIDINPSIKIVFDEDNDIKEIIPVSKDSNKIVKKINKESIETVLDYLVNMNIKDNRRPEEFQAILYKKGNINIEEVINIIEERCNHYGKTPHLIMIEKVTNSDIREARKYNVNPAKVSYIKSLMKKNSKLKLKELVSKPVYELNQMNNSGYYCDDGYTLEGEFCVKPTKKEKTVIGKVCKEGYMDYKGTCYKEGKYSYGEKDVCDEGFTLENGECIASFKEDAQVKCSEGMYDGRDGGACYDDVYIGDAYEYCRITPGEDLLYNGRCLGRKPTINGGCLGSDVVINGYCYDTSPTSGYAAEWVCPDGSYLSNADGTLRSEDHKCYEKKKVKEAEYYCNKGYTLEGKECIRKETSPQHKEIICEEGYTLVDNNRCIDKNNKSDYIDGPVCEKPYYRLENNMCIYYEEKEAKRN